MDICKNKIEQANEELQHLKEILHQKDSKINEIKKNQHAVKDTVTELNNMKAAKQQMLVLSKQAYDALETEFKGKFNK